MYFIENPQKPTAIEPESLSIYSVFRFMDCKLFIIIDHSVDRLGIVDKESNRKEPALKNISKTLNILRGNDSGEFDWDVGDTKTFNARVAQHFQGNRGAQGVYLILKNGDELIYIGKAGTLQQNGDYKRQSLPGRLRASRGKHTANAWFGNVRQQHGSLRIKYIILNNDQPPAYFEACLLMEYFSNRKQLPLLNKSF
jgi:hypothetical protein